MATTALEWDILELFPLPSALGTRWEMDGPLDFEIAAYGAVVVPSPVPPFGVPAALPLMGLAHMISYYQYGLMVIADEWHNVTWDIYGVNLLIGDHW